MATVRPLAIIDKVTSTVDYLRIAVGEIDDGWFSCSSLVEDPSALGALIATTKADRGTDRDDVATSLFVQGYAFRIASAAVGAWLVARAVLDVSPGNTAVKLGRARPNAVNLAVARVIEDATLADLHAELIEGHLAPFVGNAHATCRVGEPLLWGNVAASCAASFGAFAGTLPDGRIEVRDHAEAFFATARPEVRDAGHLVRVGDRFTWERRSCCLWYRTESAWMCEDCSLHTEEERQAKYARIAAEAATP